MRQVVCLVSIFLVALLVGCVSTPCRRSQFQQATATPVPPPAPKIVFHEDFEQYEPGTSLAEAGWVCYNSSRVKITRESGIQPVSNAVDGNTATCVTRIPCFHKLFEQPIPATADIVLTGVVKYSPGMDEACVGLLTNQDPQRYANPEGLRLFAVAHGWYLQDCSFSRDGAGNNHGTRVGVDPDQPGTCIVSIHVTAGGTKATASIRLPDGRVITTPPVALDPTRIREYKGVLLIIKVLDRNPKASFDDITVTVLPPAQ